MGSVTKPIPSVEEVRAAFAYDPDDGRLTWLEGKRRGYKAGCVTKDGYWQIRFGGHSYYAHRLVWAHQHGAWPHLQIDHRDGDKRNNRLGNLRLATNAENAQNIVAYRTNRSGYLGVCKVGGNRYLAQIQAYGRHIVLGYRDDPSEAHQLYLKAKAELHQFQPTPRNA